MKLNFQNLPRFTRNPSYRVTSDWKYLKEQLKNWSDRTGGIAAVDLNPDFQRLHVWTMEQKIAYVEYILKGGISGRDIYFNCVGWGGDYRGPFVIVDGKQRLDAVLRFLDNEVPIFNGNYFKDIEGRLPHTASFNFCVNDLKTRAEVIQWYIEMNNSGTPHTKEEIEKAQNLLKECVDKE